MLMNKISLRFSLVFSILAMGFLGIILAIIIGEQYREFSVESQRKTFREIVRLQVNDVIGELKKHSNDLGKAVQSGSSFRKMYRSTDIKQLTYHLKSQFHQYFVTAGVVKVNRLSLYDKNLNYITHAMVDDPEQSEYGKQVCGNLLITARLRTGTDKLKTLSGLCMVNGEPNFGVIVPIGGLRVVGYVEVLTDPSFNLASIESEVGLPVKIDLPDSTELYRSEMWPEGVVAENGIVASYMAKSKSGQRVLSVSIVHDIAEFRERFEKTRNTVLLVAFIATLLLALLMFLILKRSALDPIKNLGLLLRTIKNDDTSLGQTLEVVGNSEIRELSTGFNEMTQDLKNAYDRLIKANGELTTEVTERRRIENELKIHRDKLEELVEKRTADLVLARDEAMQANKAKSNFLANMSHELRTPLNAIIGYSEIILEEAVSDSELTHDVERIKSSGKHLLTLINGILDLSKIEAGKMDLYVEEFVMDHVIVDLVSTMDVLVQEYNNVMEVICDDEGMLFTDLTKVRQTLYNLLSNANKFTRNGKITLEVKRKLVGGGEFVYISVTDNGIGISRDRMPDLFQAFSQADLTTTKEFGGTGLGLIISRHFCNMMGGDINVESEEGKGSCFTMIFPADVTKKTSVGLMAVAHDEKDLPPVDPEVIRFAANKIKGRKPSERRSYVSKVLVIDDDQVSVDLMARFLAREGYRAEVALNGKEGLVKALEFKPDVITLDIMMPELDGWSVLEELKKNDETKDIPVIVLTMVDDRTRGFSLGAKEYLTKPFDRGELVGIIKNCVQGVESKTVLVVDDDKDVRAAARYALERQGWHIVEAGNGLEAIASLKQEIPQLILLDLIMPEMDGFEFLLNLRNNSEWKDVPVVVMTAKEMSLDDGQQLDECVKYVFNKGMYNFNDLFSEVNVLLRDMLRNKKSASG